MTSWIDLAVIVAYLVGTTLFGYSFFFGKGSGDAKTFMAGWILVKKGNARGSSTYRLI